MRLFIGSSNPGKISDWRNYFPTWEILSYQDLKLPQVEVEEGITSLEENAVNKARAWAAVSGEVTLSDDTGFFMNALGGFPGVSVKRWGGRFEKELGKHELLQYLQEETENIADLSCYFESAYAIADPSGKAQVFTHKLKGRLDRSLFEEGPRYAFAFGTVFKAEGIDKTWRQMTVEEKREVDRGLVEKIEETMQTFQGQSLG